MSRSRFPRARMFVAGAAVAMSGGCASGADLDRELATVRSWTATAHLAVEERRGGATTAAYTRQLRDRAAETIDQERQTLTRGAHSPEDRARAALALDSLTQAIHLLDEASHR